MDYYSIYKLEDRPSFYSYQMWIENDEITDASADIQHKPLISVVMPVYNTEDSQLRAAIDSVLGQIYKNFELILVEDHSSMESVRTVLKSYEKDPHTEIIYRETNGNISAATNDGIEKARGEFIAFMDCDDVLSANALYEVAAAVNERPDADFIYSDEDKITEDGKVRHMPFFKPDWSPDLFWCMNYTNHLSVYRTSIVREVGGLRSEYNGSQDYDFVFRFMEKSSDSKVCHIPKILYHWRERAGSEAAEKGAKDYTYDAAVNAKLDALRRRGINGRTEEIAGFHQTRVIYDIQGEPLVSIVIPSKDHPDVLKQCIESVKKYTEYKNIEIIVVDNGSSDENREIIQKYLDENGAKYIYEKMDFNFSKMCNMGVKESSGEYVLLLNDDIEIFNGSWLTRMLGQAQLPYVGAVGAKLYYPDSTKIQHAGVAVIKEGPSHTFVFLDDAQAYSFGLNWTDYDCIAVTAACLLVSRKKYDEVEGLDENFPIAYNDVDFCFKLYEAGYYNVQRNDSISYHHESLSRGNDMVDEQKLARLNRERTVLFKKHARLQQNDPFLNRNLHNYGRVLEISCNEKIGTHIEEIRIKNARADVKGCIDNLYISDNIINITGWACITERNNNDEMNMSLLLEDPYGNAYTLPVRRRCRIDVSDLLGGKADLGFCGFECTFDKNVCRFDLMPFRIGVLITDLEGKKHVLRFDKYTPDNEYIQQEDFKADAVKTLKTDSEKKKKKVCGCAESVAVSDKVAVITGWAFANKNNHYRYKKQIVLESGSEQLIFDTAEKERLDVAGEYYWIHYLFNAGYKCVFDKDCLEKNKNYSIIIRLSNMFDQNDIYEIKTDKEICI